VTYEEVAAAIMTGCAQTWHATFDTEDYSVPISQEPALAP
jgi:hypothetical protein